MNEQAPKPTPGPGRSYDREFRPLKKGEVFSAKPQGAGHDEVYQEYDRRRKETEKQEQASDDQERAKYEEYFKEACEKILDPENVIKLKRQLVGLHMTSETLTQKTQEVLAVWSEEYSQREARIEGIRREAEKLPAADQWEAGWRERAQAEIPVKIEEIDKKAHELNKKYDALQSRHDEIDEKIQQIVEKYATSFDTEGALFVEGDIWDDANDELWDKLDELLKLSFNELKALAAGEVLPEPEVEPDEPEELENDDDPEAPDDATEAEGDEEKLEEKYKKLYGHVLDAEAIDNLRNFYSHQIHDDDKADLIKHHVDTRLIDKLGAKQAGELPQELKDDLMEKVKQLMNSAEAEPPEDNTDDDDPATLEAREQVEQAAREAQEQADRQAREAREQLAKIERDQRKSEQQAREQAQLEESIKAKSKLRKPRDRRDALYELAIANNSLKAADEIISKKRFAVNPFRMFENDKIARNKALQKIAQNNKESDPDFALKAARKMNNRYKRNAILNELGMAASSSGDRAAAIQRANAIIGPGEREMRSELLIGIALTYADSNDAIQFVDEIIKDRRTRNNALVKLVEKHQDRSIIEEITSRSKKQEAEKTLKS